MEQPVRKHHLQTSLAQQHLPPAQQESPPPPPPPLPPRVDTVAEKVAHQKPPGQVTQQQQQQVKEQTKPELVSVACQTEPNLIDKLIDNHTRKQLDDVDLYQEYVRSAQCAQFWPLDKNPIRSLVPSMLKVDLPEQHLKNESLMFDLVQAITTNSKLVNLLAKYIHHIVPNVIISKRIDLIPLITCTIRVCRDTSEQERLFSLLFNLIKRPNEEQRRMILSGIIVVLQVSPNQNSSLLLPNLWDHVNDKFPERRILLAESCAPLAHYVRPIMRTNLVLSILVQLLKDKNAAVRSAACKSFACLLTLIMDRNDEVFDACLSATEDIVQDMLQQTPLSFCEHRYELEQMRFCILETIYPLVAMWAVKLNRFKVELAEFYLAKAEKYFSNLLNNNNQSNQNNNNNNNNSTGLMSPGSALTSPSSEHPSQHQSAFTAAANSARASLVAAAVSKRRSMFFESRHSNSFCSASSSSASSTVTSASSGISSLGSLGSPAAPLASTCGPLAQMRRQSAFVTSCLGSPTSQLPATSREAQQNAESSALMLTSQRAINAYLKMLGYLVPFVFSDAVHSCAWLTKSNLHSLDMADECTSSSPLSPGEIADPTRVAGLIKSPVDCNNNNNNNNQHESGQVNGVVETRAHAAQAKGRPNSFASGAQQKPTENTTSGSCGTAQVEFANKLLEPTLIVDESAIFAFHDQLKQEHMTIESVSWILEKFLPRFLRVLAHFSHKKFYPFVAAGNSNTELLQHEFLFTTLASVRQLCLLFGKHLSRSKLRPLIKRYVQAESPALFTLYIGSLTAFEPIEQQEFEEILASIKQCLSMAELTRNDVEMLAIAIKILATSSEQINSPSTRQRFLTYVLDALVNYSNQMVPPAKSLSGQSKEFMLILFRHILTCLIDPAVRPPEWAHILVTKFLPLLIMLANDATDVYVCTYARLMCAQLVDTFDNHVSCPKITQQTAASIMPALASLKSLTEQIKASNLKRQIDCLTNDLNEKFFKVSGRPQAPSATSAGQPQPKAVDQQSYS